MTTTQAQLTSLNAQATRAGGIDRLGQAAVTRKDQLTQALASNRSQLHLSLRNKALVLRDAGRIPDALAAAQQALTLANDTEKPIIQQLISELEQQKAK